MKNKVIVSVYSGIAGRCCCGCAGKHRYASEHREYSSKYRGYSVTDEDVSDRSVKIISNKVLNDPDMKDEGDHAYVVKGNRLLITYFKQD